MRGPECLLDLHTPGGDQVVTASRSRPTSSRWSRRTGGNGAEGDPAGEYELKPFEGGSVCHGYENTGPQDDRRDCGSNFARHLRMP